MKKVKKIVKPILSFGLSLSMVASMFTGFVSAVKVDEVIAEAASSTVLSNEDRGVIYADSRTDFRDETIYFLITTRFYDGDPSNNARTSEDTKAKNPENDPSWRGDFAGLIEKLDYIKALGFTAIWITPVVENNSGYDYHGYHAYDFTAVDNRYESNGITYQDLIDACHAKGMKIIQDIVLNHTCNWGERNLLQLTSDVYTERNKAIMNGTGDPNNIFHHNGFCGGGDWDNYSAQDKTIADDCFDLETENPVVNNYLIDAYTNYINMGVDAFRIDTVKHISRLTFNSTFIPAFRQAGGEKFYMFGEVCTKGHDVWYRDCPPISTCFYTWDDPTSWKSRWSNSTSANEALVQEHYAYYNNTGVQSTSDNALLNGNEYHTPDYSKASGMNVIDFQMHWSFNNANEAFRTALGEDRYFNDSTWNVVYVDSHDFGPDNNQTKRYNGGTDAWAENLDLMFTFRGIPCIFYGSEIEFQAGMEIDKGPGLPLSETGRAYYGDNIEGDVTATDFTVFGNVNGKVAETLNSTLSQHIMRLNRLRQAIPALRKGQYSTDGCSGNIAFKRRYTDSTTDSFALVAISGSATFTGIPNGTYVDAVTGDTKTVSNGTLSANASGKANMRVYVLNTSKTPAPGRVITNGNYLTDGGAAELIGPVSVRVVEPTSITLNKTSVSILEEESATVTATLAPSDVTKKSVTWTSSNNSIATVAGGNITGIAPGTATITAKTSNGLTATVKVTVKTNPNIVKPTGITVSKTSTTITEKKTETVTATVLPSNATNKTVTWSSSNESVATVSDGVITAIKEGSAVITAATINGYTATVKVTVEPRYVTSSKIYFKNTNNWSTVNAYAWSSGTNSNAAWPGEKMTCVDSTNKIYAVDLDESAGYTKIIFNNGNEQTDDLTIPGFEMIYENGSWSEYTEEGNKPSISASLNSGNVSAATKVTFTVSDATSATYSLNGAAAVKFTGSVTLTVGNGNSDTVVISAANANGTNSKTYTYTYSVQPTGSYVYFKNTSGWSTPTAYMWKGSSSNATWPGQAMTLVEGTTDVYKLKVDESKGYTSIIFSNNGGSQTADLTLPGVNKMYTNNSGVWSDYQEIKEQGTVTIKYVDESGNALTSDDTMMGDVGSAYTTTAKTISGYTLKTTPSNANGLYSSSTITVKYIYSKNTVTSKGWSKKNNNWYYYNDNGTMVIGWKQISSKWYYFNTTGVMVTGWKQINSKWYYFETSGAMVTSWKQINSKWYYFDAKGVMITGWKQISSKWYYFETTGVMVTGWLQIGAKWYYFNTTGVMATGWQKIGTKWYYFETNGEMQKSKWIGNYYLKSNGAMAVSEWVDGGKYYVDSKGLWVRNP